MKNGLDFLVEFLDRFKKCVEAIIAESDERAAGCSISSVGARVHHRPGMTDEELDSARKHVEAIIGRDDGL